MFVFKPLKYQKPTEFVNHVRMIFYIMVGTPLCIFLLLYFNFRQNNFHDNSQNLSVFWLAVLPLICFFFAGYAYYLYGKKLKEARTKTRMRERLNIVFQGTMEKFILLESVTFVVLCAYFVNQHILYAGLYMVMLILFAMSNPTIFTVINGLRLSREQSAAMQQNHTIQ